MAENPLIPQSSSNPDATGIHFNYDSEKMLSVTSKQVIKEGLTCFREDRVTDMKCADRQLSACVEGSEKDVSYFVELESLDTGELSVSCQCTDSMEKVCKHAIAILYYFADKAPQSKIEVKNALEEAIEERVKKGRTEVNVRKVSGDLWFGSWQASSITSATHRPQIYKVDIRSLTHRNNYCSCPDLETNQLGTCKHIEAVLHQISKQGNYQQMLGQSPPFPFIYLDWDVEHAPKIRLKRSGKIEPDLNQILDQNFDLRGDYQGRLPDSFFIFTDTLYGRSDIHMGEDVQSHIKRLTADISSEMRALKIKDKISQNGGIFPGINARLYPYQVEGVAFLAGTGRCLLADDMGLGKTLQAIAAASWLRGENEIEKILIVCPASLKHQWAREIEKFTDHNVQIIQGGPDKRQAQYRKGKTFVIVNYELVLRDLTVINELHRPDLIILDEAQRIKNWRTKIASTIKLIPSNYAFVLSGTPLENRLEDLYSLMQVVDSHVLGPLWKYLLDFHVTDDRGKVLGYRNLAELRRRLHPVMLRRDRRLVRDQLPDKTEILLDVPMSEKQQELHGDALSTAGRIAHAAKRRPLTPSEQHRLMSALQMARMACNAAGLVDKETIGSPKLDELALILDDLCLQNGLKVVVFSQWERMTFMVEELLYKMKIGCVRLHGGIPTAKRGDLMDKFQDDDATQVFISTDAGGVGLNLQSGSALVNLDIPWNPAVLEQRIARIHRLGQKNKVQIIKMVAENSYEESVLKLLMGKQDLFDNVIDPDGEEDVVGVSKRMLETLIEDLSDKSGPGNQPPSTPLTTPPADDLPLDETPDPEIARQEIEDKAVLICIENIQKEFGSRVERILGTGGGLLVIMAPVHEKDDLFAARLSEEVPVALMEPGTYTGLQRLGSSSPLASMVPLFELQQETNKPVVSPMLILAKEKLRAAEALIDKNCPAVCSELLATSMIAALVSQTETTKPPELAEATVWVYSEAIPQGLLNSEQASIVTRAISLINATTLPDKLLEQILNDARELISRYDR